MSLGKSSLNLFVGDAGDRACPPSILAGSYGGCCAPLPDSDVLQLAGGGGGGEGGENQWEGNSGKVGRGREGEKVTEVCIVLYVLSSVLYVQFCIFSK